MREVVCLRRRFLSERHVGVLSSALKYLKNKNLFVLVSKTRRSGVVGHNASEGASQCESKLSTAQQNPTVCLNFKVQRWFQDLTSPNAIKQDAQQCHMINTNTSHQSKSLDFDLLKTHLMNETKFSDF